MKPATAWERRVLDVMLTELRRAMKLRSQLTIIIDPFTNGGGTHLFAAPNEAGKSYTIDDADRPASGREGGTP
ncbi:MAG: hypothetical protein Q8S13_11320 [Dehalococcoidia bacterium]|nr:hypothetical protein [Dehalococcoidia bacterium]